MDAVTNLQVPDGATAEEGHLALEQTRFHLVKGDGPAAAKAAKGEEAEEEE